MREPTEEVEERDDVRAPQRVQHGLRVGRVEDANRGVEDANWGVEDANWGVVNNWSLERNNSSSLERGS